jgi:hypothetical protein
MRNRQATIAGIFLIAIGLFWWLNLGWLLLPAALMIGGVAGYLQRRAIGREQEALQAGLWGIGLGFLFLIGFVWPGILFLTGASVLLQGREGQLRGALENVLARARGRVRSIRRTEHVPVESVPTFEVPTQTGETSRLHE